MADKIEKSIPWLIILAIGIMVVFGIGIILKEAEADADISKVTVGNATPTIGTVALDGGTDINLTETVTTTVSATTTVTDTDGHEDISSITGKIYRSGVGTSCTANDNNCYSDSACATSFCSGNSCTATCEAEIWFHADPTDLGTYSAEYWEAYIKVADTDNATSSATSTGVEMNTLRALDISTSTIGYGNLDPGSTTGSFNPTTTITDTGNEAMDIYLYGVDMESGVNDISVGFQSYATSSFNYATSHEDFTTFTELDPNNHVTTTVDRTTHDNWHNEEAWVYYDYGTSSFSGFEHLLDVECTYAANNRTRIFWALANQIDDNIDIWSVENDDILWINYWGGLGLRMSEGTGGSSNADTYSDASIGTTYYLKIVKNGTNLYCEIYLDSARTNLLDTLSLTLQSDHSFRYLYSAQSWEIGSAQHADGWCENLDLGLGGTPLTNVTSTEVEVDLSKPTSHPSTSTDIIYWGVRVPSAQAPGTYNGTNSFDAKAD